MRAALILAVFLTIAVAVAIFAARRFVARQDRRRRVSSLEEENDRLDAILDRDRDRSNVFRDR